MHKNKENLWVAKKLPVLFVNRCLVEKACLLTAVVEDGELMAHKCTFAFRKVLCHNSHQVRITPQKTINEFEIQASDAAATESNC